ncbi:MAG: hypothetical protein PVF07_13915 [Thiogranum sp.]|jgi:hypothetical protein
MQHIDTPTLQFDGHNTLWRVVTYLFVAFTGLVALYEHSVALLAVMAAAFALVLALSARITRLENTSAARPDSRPLGDGGSFPGSAPETPSHDSGTARVLDGGSLEHHRS